MHPAAVIKHHTLPGAFGLESLSPFCMKVEVYLKLAGLPYEVVAGDPRRAPKGKLPFVEDDGTVVCDSGTILEHFEKKRATPFDRDLGAEERARAHLVRRTLEESFYFVLLWSRWAEEDGWAVVKTFFDALPVPVRWIAPPVVRKKVLDSIRAQGIGRHARDEIYRRGKEDLDAVATVIGDGPFVLGPKVTTVDATAYAFLANVLRAELDTPLRDHVKKDARLRSYVERVAERLRPAS